jgi:hypothetical protein
MDKRKKQRRQGLEKRKDSMLNFKNHLPPRVDAPAVVSISRKLNITIFTCDKIV